MTPAPTATPMPTPSPVPDILPGGAKFMGYTDDGDFEYSLFGE